MKNHPAPYLALHGDDPVAWQLWDQKTVQRAQAENKMLFLSVGYFSCHWCHVMQRESYQDQQVAELLNQHFISVKIDRELEPALDSRLMRFAQQILRRGGWPLNVFLTPEGKPIYALLYAPQPNFLTVIDRLQQVWNDDSQKVRQLVAAEPQPRFTEPSPELDADIFSKLIKAAPKQIMVRADAFEGGFGYQNKFPSVPQLMFLLSNYRQLKDTGQAEEIYAFLTLTLDQMATQGLQDHLSGGFFRYSVDPGWEVPHFEKMLYDNANLASLYMLAGETFGIDRYHQIARRTLGFMQRYMWAESAFVGSFSAVDEQNVEGGYYLWTEPQLHAPLNDEERSLITAIWGLDRPSELEAGNHIRWQRDLAWYAEHHGLSVAAVRPLLDSAINKLLIARESRSLPVDDKLITGWNGLALSAFSHAAKLYDDDSYFDTAARLQSFFAEQLWNDGELVRAIAKGSAYGSASLEDYAYMARGLWQWSAASGDQEAADYAVKLARLGWQRFYKDYGWYRQADDLLVPSIGTEIMQDGPSASPAAVLIETSFLMATALNDHSWLKTIKASANRGVQQLKDSAFWYVSQLAALQTILEN